MPGVGVRTGARILIEVGDGSTFPTADHLAANPGFAPGGPQFRVFDLRRTAVPERERAAQTGFLPLPGRRPGRDPASRAYYDRKIAQGKHYTQALLCLARRRADILFAMLRDGTFYEPQPIRAT
jgi:hypothetical protein